MQRIPAVTGAVGRSCTFILSPPFYTWIQRINEGQLPCSDCNLNTYSHMFPPKRGKSLGAASDDNNVTDMMNKILNDGTMTTEEKFDWLCRTVTDQQGLIEKRDLELIALNRETETLQLQVVDLDAQIAAYRQQAELQEQELSRSDIFRKRMARQDLVKEEFIKCAERSNKRLTEENASQSRLIGYSAKRARMLESVRECQEEEIGDLQAQAALSESILVAYEKEIMRYREERRQWEIETGSGPIEEESQRLRNRLAKAIAMADEVESRVLATRTSTGLLKAKTRVVCTCEDKTRRQETPVQKPSQLFDDKSGWPLVDIETTLSDEEPAEEPTADGDDSDESVESDADDYEGPWLQSHGAIRRAQDAPKSPPQPQGGPAMRMQFESPKFQQWNMPGPRSYKGTHGLHLQGSPQSSSSSPNYTPAYIHVGPQMEIGRPLLSQTSPYTLAIHQSLPSDRVAPGSLVELYGSGVQVSPFSGIPLGGSFSRHSASPSTNGCRSTLQSDLLSSLDEVGQKVEQKALEGGEGQEASESDSDEQSSIVGSVTDSQQLSIASESSEVEHSLDKRRGMNDEPASLRSVVPCSETPYEDMEDDGDVNGQGSLLLAAAGDIAPIQQIPSGQDLPERQDEEMDTGDGKEEEMKDFSHSDSPSTSEERPRTPKGWDRSHHASPKLSPSSYFSGYSYAASDSFEYEDEVIGARHRMHEMIQDGMRAEELPQRMSSVHLVNTPHGPASMAPMPQRLKRKRKREKLRDDVSEGEGEEEVTAIQALPVDETETEGVTREPSQPVQTAESGTQTEVEGYQEAWCQTEEYPRVSKDVQTEECPEVSYGTQTRRRRRQPGEHASTQTQTWHTSDSGTQTKAVEAVSASIQADMVPIVKNADTQTIRLPAGSSTRDTDTQAEEPCFEAGAVKAVRSNPHPSGLLQRLSTGLVIVLLVCLWMSGRERRMWLHANDMSRQALVDLRDGARMRCPWLQTLDLEIARRLEMDLVEIG
ncbi:hypothetical protein VTN02DRAFT_1874 [Thermoascus thermophilus]